MRNLILTLIIWVICFTALVAGVSLTYNWYRQLGVDITISFNNVDGIVPNQSKVLYRGVQVGTINDIKLDHTTGKPIVYTRISKDAAKILGKNSRFWIVRPELAFGSVRNLSTIASGEYIEMDPVKGPFSSEFVGLDDEPIEETDVSGMKLILYTSTASGLEIGSSVLYRGLHIGEIGDMGISKDKKHIKITVYIQDEFKSIVRKNSCFTNVSGFHASLHVFGASHIDMDSFKTLMRGGIAVHTQDFNVPPARAGDSFVLLTPKQVQEMEENS